MSGLHSLTIGQISSTQARRHCPYLFIVPPLQMSKRGLSTANKFSLWRCTPLKQSLQVQKCWLLSWLGGDLGLLADGYIKNKITWLGKPPTWHCDMDGNSQGKNKLIHLSTFGTVYTSVMWVNEGNRPVFLPWSMYDWREMSRALLSGPISAACLPKAHCKARGSSSSWVTAKWASASRPTFGLQCVLLQP